MAPCDRVPSGCPVGGRPSDFSRYRHSHLRSFSVRPPQYGRRRNRRRVSIREVGAPGVTRTPDSQFRKLLAVPEVLDISIAPSGLAGPRRAWTAAAASETGRRSAVCEGKGFDDPDPRFLANLRDAILRNAAKRGMPRPTASHIYSDTLCAQPAEVPAEEKIRILLEGSDR